MDVEEIEDREFGLLLGKKRHEEIKGSLQSLANAINKNNQNQEVAKAIGSNTGAINGLIEKIASLRFDSKNVNVQPPNVTVHNNQKEVVEEIKSLKEGIVEMKELLTRQNEILEELCRPKEWDFQIYKDDLGRLKGVRANQITQKAKKINYGYVQ